MSPRFGEIPANVIPSASGSWPPGALVPHGGAATPAGFLLCDGSAVSQATYAALFAVIGHKHGADPGGGNFRLPNLVDKIPVGPSAGKLLGARGGAIAHTHAVGSMAADHFHLDGSLYAPDHAHGLGTLALAEHQHNVTETSKQTLTGASGFYDRALGGATAAGISGGVTGSIYGCGNLDVYGQTNPTSPATTGASGPADPPYVAVRFLVKT